MMINRRGSVAAMSAILMIAVVGVSGLAIDLTRIWMVSARLKTSVDAAALVAARQIDSGTRDADTRALFLANYTMNGTYPNTTVGRYLGAAIINEAQITPIGTRQIRVTARVRIGTTLFSIISPSTTDVEETSVAERGGSGLELAISLDATSSMLRVVNGRTKLASAQEATGTLLDILYGDRDVQPNLWVSVASFSRTINVGATNTGVLDFANAPAGFNPARWGGCVRARLGANDVADLDPAATGLPPYWWPSTYRRVGWASFGSGNTNPPSNDVVNDPRNRAAWLAATGNIPPYNGAAACQNFSRTVAYPPVTIRMLPRGSNVAQNYTVSFCQGDNDWGSGLPNIGALNNGTRFWQDFSRNYPEENTPSLGPESDLNTAAVGPNFQCSVQPILPLTASRATVRAAVNAITVQAAEGTTTPAGLHGAWYTLSPRWRGRWPGIASGGALGALPLDYRSRNADKAIIILTDGANNWQHDGRFGDVLSRVYDTDPENVRGIAAGNELLYSYYGRAADFNVGRAGAERIDPVLPSNSRSALDARFTALCNAIKATGINLYIVAFEVTPGSRADTLLQACATQPTSPFFLRAPTAAELNNAFTIIGNQLTTLRLSE